MFEKYYHYRIEVSKKTCKNSNSFRFTSQHSKFPLFFKSERNKELFVILHGNYTGEFTIGNNDEITFEDFENLYRGVVYMSSKERKLNVICCYAANFPNKQDPQGIEINMVIPSEGEVWTQFIEENNKFYLDIATHDKVKISNSKDVKYLGEISQLETHFDNME